MKSAISVAFGDVLRQHREDAALSQEALAHESEIHRTYVSMIERGIRHPTLDVVFRLAEALAVAPSTLVGETEGRLKRRRR
jgi:transcriptional regulator with XRE-family HTH domain